MSGASEVEVGGEQHHHGAYEKLDMVATRVLEESLVHGNAFGKLLRDPVQEYGPISPIASEVSSMNEMTLLPCTRQRHNELANLRKGRLVIRVREDVFL